MNTGWKLPGDIYSESGSSGYESYSIGNLRIEDSYAYILAPYSGSWINSIHYFLGDEGQSNTINDHEAVVADSETIFSWGSSIEKFGLELSRSQVNLASFIFSIEFEKVLPNAGSFRIDLKDFNFGIPSGNIISGYEAKVSAYSTTSYGDNRLYIRNVNVNVHYEEYINKPSMWLGIVF